MVKIRLFGELGARFRKEYNFAVSSVSEAIHALNINNSRKLYPWLAERDKAGIRYKMVINGKPFYTEQNLMDVKNLSTSELMINRKLESIDIIPIIEGADSDIFGIFTIILGVLLIATGIGAALGVGFLAGIGAAGQAAFILGGAALLFGGIASLLTRAPEFDDFREIESGGGKNSYLFNGPENVVREGGPVPVGYGRLIVGSQVISASYVISNIDANAQLSDKDTTPGAINTDGNQNDPKNVAGITSADVVRALAINTIKGTIIAPQTTNTDIQNSRRKVIYPRAFQDPNSYSEDAYPKLIGASSLLTFGNNQSFYHVLKNNNNPIFYTFSRRGTYNGHLVVGGDFDILFSRGRFEIPSGVKANLLIISDMPLSGTPQQGYDGTVYGYPVYLDNIAYGSYIDSSLNTFICGAFSNIIDRFGNSVSSQPKLLKLGPHPYSASSLASWGGISGGDSILRCVTVDSNNKIYIGGSFTTLTTGSVTRGRLARLSSAGANDATFADPDIENGTVYDIKLDSSNRVVTVGNFTTINGDNTKSYIVRFNTDGSLDGTFNIPVFAGSDVRINSVYIQTANGYILIAGKWTTVDGHSSPNLARLKDDGTVDTSFVSRFDPGEADVEVYKVLVRDDANFSTVVDGTIFAGGKWNKYADYQRPNFVMMYNGEYLK